MNNLQNFILDFLVNSTWQLCALSIAGALLLRLMRRMWAKDQYRVALAVLIMGLIMPLMSSVHLMKADRVQNNESMAPIRYEPSSQFDNSKSAPTDRIAAVTHLRLSLSQTTIRAVVLTYLIFIMVRICILIWSWWRLIKLKNSNLKRIKIGTIGELESIRVYESTNVAVPLSYGIIKPEIIFPSGFIDNNSEETIRAVLAHELVHVRNRDFLTNSLIEVLSIFIGFHPATTLLKQRVALMREVSCDEAAIEELRISRVEYAKTLLNVATSVSVIQPSRLALGFASACDLEKRVRQIVAKSVSRPVTKLKALLIASLLIGMLAVAPVFGINVQNSAKLAEFSGHWALDDSRSSYSGNPPYKKLIVDINVLDKIGVQILRIEQLRTDCRGETKVETDLNTDWRPFKVVLPGEIIAEARTHWRDNHLVTFAQIRNPFQSETDDAYITDRGNTLVIIVQQKGESGENRYQFVFTKSLKN